MKKAMHVSRLFLLAGFLFLNACKKNDEEPATATASQAEAATKVTAWVEKQKSLNATENRAQIQALQNSLLLRSLWTEVNEDKQVFFIVPVRGDFETQIDKGGKHNDYLVVLLDGKMNIAKGSIVQYSSKASDHTAIGKNILSRIFTKRELNCEGTFTVLTLASRYLYQLKF